MKDILFQNEYIRHIKSKNIFVSILYVILSLITSLIPILLINVINYVIAKNFKLAIYNLILITITYIIFAILKSLIEYISTIIEEENKIEIIKILINKISVQPCKNIDKDIYLSYLFNDVENICNLYLANIYNFYSCISILIFSILSLIYINIYALGLVIILSIISMLIPKIFEEKLKISQKLFSDSQEKYLYKINNLFSGLIYFIYNNRLNNFNEQIKKENYNLKKETLSNINIRLIYTNTLTLFNTLSKFLVSFLVCILIYLGQVSFGAFFGITNIFSNFLNAFINLSEIFGKIKMGRAIFEKFDSFIINNNENNKKINEINKINLEDVKVDNKLNNITLSIEKGNKYIIIGESGSGKSTLIKTLLDLEEYSGTININNIDFQNIDIKDVYKNIEYVDDSKNILLADIYNNISLFKSYDKSKIDNILNLLNLTNLIDKKMLNKNELSTGEIQRIKLARMIYNNKDIYILDEVFLNIDNKNREIIKKYLKDTNKTIIEVTHHLDDIYYDDYKLIKIKI